jgi:hypothetical protein
MIPSQAFCCPHCGAPGLVNLGQAEYSCMCRFNANAYKKALEQIAAFPPGDFRPLEDEVKYGSWLPTL